MDRRTLLAATAASAAAGILPTRGMAAESTRAVGEAVRIAKIERSQGTGKMFVPLGEFRPLDPRYVEEEWFASGIDDFGQPYKTLIYLRRPRDAARFSGVVIVEPLHASANTPVHSYCGPYIARSGHGWACVASQKTPLDSRLKASNPDRYASLHIEAGGPPPGAMQLGAMSPAEWQARIEALGRYNRASSSILAQTGAALRGPGGPFGRVRHTILVGHSQTGGVVTNYVREAHEARRRADGGSIYDGYYPTGAAGVRFGPRDVPLIQLLSDADIDDPVRSNGRAYRREDSDAPHDRYRLYELAGAAHMGTRNPPHNETAPWVERTGGAIKAGDRMTSYPHNEMFNMGLSHLVRWITEGKAPPRGERIATGPDGMFLKDEFGNTRGGVRCAQMDVPHVTYHPDPPGSQSVVGTETPFDAARMRSLYQTPANYARRFNARLDTLIAQGWFLKGDAPDMRAEAAAQQF
ncbi:MAG TPA: alpha/beta hydrolase domain-containing protein [Novosphingobium sp.]